VEQATQFVDNGLKRRTAGDQLARPGAPKRATGYWFIVYNRQTTELSPLTRLDASDWDRNEWDS
jgi:hypothetical protein